MNSWPYYAYGYDYGSGPLGEQFPGVTDPVGAFEPDAELVHVAGGEHTRTDGIRYVDTTR